jgi:hypothetical protein
MEREAAWEDLHEMSGSPSRQLPYAQTAIEQQPLAYRRLLPLQVLSLDLDRARMLAEVC